MKATEGVVVGEVEAEGPAADAGLQPGDVILEVDRVAVGDGDTLRKALDAAAGKRPALLLVTRQGNTLFLTMGRGADPATEPAPDTYVRAPPAVSFPSVSIPAQRRVRMRLAIPLICAAFCADVRASGGGRCALDGIGVRGIIVARRFLVSGRVQGVGFRFFTKTPRCAKASPASCGTCATAAWKRWSRATPNPWPASSPRCGTVLPAPGWKTS